MRQGNRTDSHDDRGRNQGTGRHWLRERWSGFRGHEGLYRRFWPWRFDRLWGARGQGLCESSYRRGHETGTGNVPATDLQESSGTALRTHRRHGRWRSAGDLSVSRKFTPGGGSGPPWRGPDRARTCPSWKFERKNNGGDRGAQCRDYIVTVTTAGYRLPCL